MFFGFSDRADRNGDGKVDMWEAAEELYAYDSIMEQTSADSARRMTEMIPITMTKMKMSWTMNLIMTSLVIIVAKIAMSGKIL